MDNVPNRATAEGRSVKRRRVALACDACRTRKSRCDGRRPKCGMCENLDFDFDCVYTAPVTAANVIVQKDYLSSLEQRVKTLEDSLNTVKSELSAVASKVNGEISNALIGEIKSSRQNEHFADLAGTEDIVDAVGAVAFTNEEDCGFFGASSSIAFLRYLFRAVTRVKSTQEEITSTPIKHASEKQSGIFTLPSDDGALALIQRFFGDTGLLFPYIHSHTFFETYSELRKERSPAELCLRESAVYYTRAFDICKGEILRGTTLEVVQFLLLMGQYLQGTHKSVQAWTTHGLTVKAAVQLGLHPKDASRVFPPLEQEMRKRTWFGCVILHRVLSMTFERPAVIPDCYIHQGRDGVLFFNATITLYKQMAFMIDQLYAQNLGCGCPLPVREILLSWVLALPESLRQVTVQTMRAQINDQQPREYVPEPRLFPLKFRVVLTLRYLHFLDITGMLVVSEGVVERAEGRLPNDIRYSGLNKCVESAMGIMDIIHELVSSSYWPRDLLGVLWYSLYYMATTLCKLNRGNRIVDRCSYYLEELISALRLYPQRSTNRRRCSRCVCAPNMGFPAMNTAASTLGFPSLGVEGCEFMVDDFFTGLARDIDTERW
ncbi:fungal-specific transcription factor domain-containing protein [Aspergillus germanicus]